MRRDHVEAAVAVQQRDVVSDRDRRDEAVRQAPDRRSGASTSPVECRGGLVVGGLVERQEATAVEQAPQVARVPLAACPVESEPCEGSA
jgi:hypothetical protein